MSDQAKLFHEWRRAHEHGELPMITIYERPADYPDRYVARLFLIRRKASSPLATNAALTAPSLDKLRAMLEPLGLHRIPREAGDELPIVETWV